MRPLLRICALCLALCCLLWGCAASAPPIPEPYVRELTLCLEPSSGEQAAKTAGTLADMMYTISGGGIHVEIVEDELALDAILSSRYDLYLITNNTASLGLGDYAAFSSPYFFDDYYHMSMSLNSERFGRLLDARTSSALNVTPLIAFYAGSRVFIHGISMPIAGLDDLIESEPAVIPTQDGILERQLGVRSGNILEIDEIVFNFERRRTLLFDFYKRDMDMLVYHERLGAAYLIDDYHIVDINWIMMSSDTANELSEWEMAVIEEAAAYALADNDTAVLAREAQMINTFKKRFGEASILDGGTVAHEFRAEMRNTGRYVNMWNWDIYDEIRTLTG